MPDSYTQLNDLQFDRTVRTENLRQLQIIHFAFMTGATMFAVVVLSLAAHPLPNEKPDLELINTLSIVHALIAVSAFGIARILFEQIFSEKNLNNAIDMTAAPYDDSLSVIRTALIIRTAIMEGAALFGLVVCLIAVTGGAAQHEPLYLLNTASYVVFMTAGFLTFPTRNSVMDLFRKYILKRF